MSTEQPAPQVEQPTPAEAIAAPPEPPLQVLGTLGEAHGLLYIDIESKLALVRALQHDVHALHRAFWRQVVKENGLKDDGSETYAIRLVGGEHVIFRSDAEGRPI